MKKLLLLFPAVTILLLLPAITPASAAQKGATCQSLTKQAREHKNQVIKRKAVVETIGARFTRAQLAAEKETRIYNSIKRRQQQAKRELAALTGRSTRDATIPSWQIINDSNNAVNNQNQASEKKRKIRQAKRKVKILTERLNAQRSVSIRTGQFRDQIRQKLTEASQRLSSAERQWAQTEAQRYRACR